MTRQGRPGTSRAAQSGRSRGKVRIEDVAGLAGVSAITVSRALRTPGVVSADTRQRIETAIERLGYVPNLAAGTLASRRSRLVAVIVPTLRSSVYAMTIQGLSDELNASGYHPMVGYAGYSSERELELLRAFIGRQPDGVVLTGVEHKPETRQILRSRKLPTVEIWDVAKDPIDVAIGFDNEGAGACIADYFATIGVRRSAILSGHPAGEHRARKRVAGFKARCVERGMKAPVTEFLDDGMSTMDAEQGFARLISQASDIEAIFCVNDTLAIAGLMEARRRGIEVPRQLRIAGFGDFDLAAHTAPRLTTVRLPGYQIGRRAARRILDRLDGAAEAPLVENLGFELIVRESA